jgi:hypothetical protein
MTFGQGLSYFACDIGQRSIPPMIWAGLPPELEEKLVSRQPDTPLCVALGKHTAWVVLYSNGYIDWRFYGYYSGLDKILRDATHRPIAVSVQTISFIVADRN